jgi:TolB-like protein/DNA-binding winged helix-turn-helix (wHTH) protein/Tfp pilus assembly protein PilF
MPEANHLFAFGPFQIDAAERRLTRDGTPVPLTPKAFDLLLVLVEQGGHLVTKDALMQRVWPDVVVEEANLAVHISTVRRALGDRNGDGQYIETVPKQGYRFREPVRKVIARTGAVPPIEAPPSVVPAVPPIEPLRPASPSTRFGRRARRYGFVALTVAAAVVVFVAYKASALRRGTRGRPSVRSLAVLPLKNLSRDPEQEYFSDGMTDELITELARISQLRVISHSSVGRYKDSQRPLPEIARELGVDAVVEGSVSRSGDRVRITAQLIDGRTDIHLWADMYEDDVRDVLALQDRVAARIASQIGITLTSEQERVASALVVSPAAHEAYLKGTFYWNKLSCVGFRKAAEYFEQAVATDPAYAAAHAALADTYLHLGDWQCSPQEEMFRKARVSAAKALDVNPSLAAAHAVLGDLAFRKDWDWPKADAEFTRATELEPNDGRIRASYAIFLVAMGRQEQGVAQMEKAHELDPVSERTNVVSSYLFYLSHQFDRAIEQANKTLELYPFSGSAYHWLGRSYQQKRMPDRAAAAYLHTPPGPESPWLLGARRAYEKGGLRGFWLYQRERTEEGKPLDACWDMSFMAHLGDKARTLDLLESGVESHCDGLQFLRVEPIYDIVRDDPRYEALLERLHLKPPAP